MPAAAAKVRAVTPAPSSSNGPRIVYDDYQPRGACMELFKRRDHEIILEGPAGTGKTRATLEKCHWMLSKRLNVRGLMIRKTRRSMTQSCIVTYESKVLFNEAARVSQLDAPGGVRFHGGDQEYRYANGSIFAVAGIDDPKKIYSSEWDFAYVNQAEELTEEEWEQVRSRLRNNRMPYQQLLGDCNPDAPQHWIKLREATGALTSLPSRHEDNPMLWDADKGDWTEFGREYVLGTLDSLTGVRKLRLRFGLWRAAEGSVYEEVWDSAVHVIPRIMADSDLRKDQVPKDWPRYWVVDFGFKNPFVWQAWARDPDGRLYMYKEIYRTQRTVEDHCKTILAHTADDPKPQAIICDHDAEDRASMTKRLGEPLPGTTYHVGMQTRAAFKAVSSGIQAVTERLKIAADGKPRLFYLRDSLIELDRDLLDKKLPTCSATEYEVYIWDQTANRRRGEEPKKDFDHGMDATRYLVAHVDEVGRNIPKMFKIGGVTRSGASGVGGGLEQPSAWRMGGGSGLGTRWSNT